MVPWLFVCVLLAATPCVAQEITTKVGSFTVRTKLGSAAQDTTVVAIAMTNAGLIAMVCSLEQLSSRRREFSDAVPDRRELWDRNSRGQKPAR